MKKVILTIAAMAIAASAFAQASVGVRAGGNYANLNGQYDAKFKAPFIGAYAGAAVQYSLDNVFDGFGIRGEVNFSCQGAASKHDAYTKYKTTVNYINIPLMAEYSIFDGALSFMVGPQLGINLNGKTKTVLGTSKDNQVTSKDTISADGINTTDFGFVFGATYMFVENIGIDFRYNLGLTKVFDSKLIDTFNGNVKNSVISAGILYKF